MSYLASRGLLLNYFSFSAFDDKHSAIKDVRERKNKDHRDRNDIKDQPLLSGIPWRLQDQ